MNVYIAKLKFIFQAKIEYKPGKHYVELSSRVQTKNSLTPSIKHVLLEDLLQNVTLLCHSNAKKLIKVTH
jgi:hypothetical protein